MQCKKKKQLDRFYIDNMAICGRNFSYINANFRYRISKLVFSWNCIEYSFAIELAITEKGEFGELLCCLPLLLIILLCFVVIL